MPPRIAVIGFGMSGLGALHALRHSRRFTASDFHPDLTVFEADVRPGGKAAPDNLGAQFLDADLMYPFDRILPDLRLRTFRPRQDYELVRLRLGNSATIQAASFRDALLALRDAMGEALRSMSFAALDALTVQRFLDVLRHRGRIDAGGQAAMRQRMLLEDGTVKLSALGYALSLAKTPTPVRRLEVVGGLYAVAKREREAALREGVTFRMGAPVERIDVKRDSAVVWSGGAREEFDRAILAVSPEHLARIRISGGRIPIEPLKRLQAARITKSNLVMRNPPTVEEHATERYALWYTSRGGTPHESTATFFHGWEGQAPLSVWQMVKAVAGIAKTKRLIRCESHTWDGTARDGGVGSAYVSEPRPGECVPLLRLSRDLYFRGAHDASPLTFASHALGIGATVREAALTGEWAAVAAMRGLGLDVTPALKRVADPELELYGASGEILKRELDEAGSPRPRMKENVPSGTGKKASAPSLGGVPAVLRKLVRTAGSVERAAGDIVKAICHGMSWDLGECWHPDAAGRQLTLHHVWHPPDERFEEFESVSRGIAFQKGGGLPGSLWLRNEPILMSGLSSNPAFPRSPLAGRAGLWTGAGFPVRRGDALVGVFCFYSRKRELDEAALLTELAGFRAVLEGN